MMFAILPAVVLGALAQGPAAPGNLMPQDGARVILKSPSARARMATRVGHPHFERSDAASAAAPRSPRTAGRRPGRTRSGGPSPGLARTARGRSQPCARAAPAPAPSAPGPPRLQLPRLLLAPALAPGPPPPPRPTSPRAALPPPPPLLPPRLRRGRRQACPAPPPASTPSPPPPPASVAARLDRAARQQARWAAPRARTPTDTDNEGCPSTGARAKSMA